MYRRVAILVPLALGLVLGCSPPADRSEEASAPSEPLLDQRAAGVDLDDPSILPRPYTSEQIRDQWAPGLTLVFRHIDGDGESFQRMQVVSADAESVDIAYNRVDAEGRALDERRVERARFRELRDHATFGADHATRRREARDTPLGRLEGWLYVVRDASGDAVTEFFFADRLPGPPVEMRRVRGEQQIMEMVQLRHELTE